jgi:hypothetical protein
VLDGRASHSLAPFHNTPTRCCLFNHCKVLLPPSHTNALPLQLQLELQLSYNNRLHLLAEGGVLVYSTCSLNPLENEAVVMAALVKSSLAPHGLGLRKPRTANNERLPTRHRRGVGKPQAPRKPHKTVKL